MAKSATQQLIQIVGPVDAGHFEGVDQQGHRFSARFDLYLIQTAWYRGLNLEDLADGFGRGLGTMGGDWSGIRDSSEDARRAMLERTLNFMAGLLD